MYESSYQPSPRERAPEKPDFGQVVATRTESVAARLERRFGLGTRPDLRRELYGRLERLYEEADDKLKERIHQVIASVVADSAGKQDSGRYFAFVVWNRLTERHCTPAMTF